MLPVWDWIIVGSGFGGSVSALRLAEKGYTVLVIEKGRRFGPDDFPRSNWDLKRWMWIPSLGFRGLFKMTYLPHVTALSGVGVGGGSLVYANTLPIPRQEFFTAPSWASLADWQRELESHYREARRMLGATVNPLLTVPDQVLQDIAREDGNPAAFEPATVAVHFGEPGVTVPDPYFGGRGPTRTGCVRCGGCMLGCRFGAKNTLDKNYLYLAEQLGVAVRADTEVTWVRPVDGVYEVSISDHATRERTKLHASRVIFAGGVMGTVDLLLRLQESAAGLPSLSPRLGEHVRTNSEALLAVTSQRRDIDLSRGIAIGSILNTDASSHLEPVRYPAGSGYFRLFGAPHVTAGNALTRLLAIAKALLRHPLKMARAYLVPDWARFTMILLYMRSLEGHLSLRLGRHPFTLGRRGLVTRVQGERPRAHIPEASVLADRVATKIDGVPMSLINETLMDVPTTAHILGGCCMGADASAGVIDHQHRVFGYEGLYVIDGSAVSANPGVNPSLTIAALAERAMTFIPEKR